MKRLLTLTVLLTLLSNLSLADVTSGNVVGDDGPTAGTHYAELERAKALISSEYKLDNFEVKNSLKLSNDELVFSGNVIHKNPSRLRYLNGNNMEEVVALWVFSPKTDQLIKGFKCTRTFRKLKTKTIISSDGVEQTAIDEEVDLDRINMTTNKCGRISGITELRNGNVVFYSKESNVNTDDYNLFLYDQETMKTNQLTNFETPAYSDRYYLNTKTNPLELEDGRIALSLEMLPATERNKAMAFGESKIGIWIYNFEKNKSDALFTLGVCSLTDRCLHVDITDLGTNNGKVTYKLNTFTSKEVRGSYSVDLDTGEILKL